MILLRNNSRSKPICKYTMGGKYICEYPSIMEASRDTGIPKSNISASARLKRVKIKDRVATKRSAGGFIWKFK